MVGGGKGVTAWRIGTDDKTNDPTGQPSRASVSLTEGLAHALPYPTTL